MAKNGLSSKQKRAITALLTAESIEAAAGVAKVGHRTLTRWLAEDVEFQTALREAQNRALDTAVSRLTGAAMTAAHVLETIAEDEKEKGSTRVSAARALLGNVIKLVEIRDLSERLTMLERAMNVN